MKNTDKYLWLFFPAFLAGVYLLDFNGLYGQDAFEYYRCSCEVFLKNTEPCHFPVIYPLYGKMIAFVAGEIMGLQLISILAATAILFIVSKLIRLFYSDTSEVTIYVFLFGGLSAYFFRSVPLVMSDMLNTLLITGGLYFMVLFQKDTEHKKPQLPWAIFSVLLLLQAVFTRYASGVLVLYYLGCFLFLVIPRLTIRQNFILILSGGVILSVLSLLQYEFIAQGKNHSHLLNWSFRNFLLSEFSTGDGNLKFRVNNFMYGLFNQIHPGFILPSGLLIFLFSRKSFSSSFLIYLWIPAVLYLVFLMGIPFQNTRFYLLVFPVWLILFYGPFMKAIELLEKVRLKRVFYGIVLITQGVLCYYSVQPTLLQNRLEKKMVQAIHNHSSAPAIYTMGMEGMLKSYKITAPVTSLYYEKITQYKENSLILIQPQAFEYQWKGKIPGENLSFIRNHYQTDTLAHFEKGWELYLLKTLNPR